MSWARRLCLVTFLCCLVALCESFPRKSRQSFFRCSGWGAGCTNMDYGSKEKTEGGEEDSSEENGQKQPVSMPYLFTSGRSWGAIGKRWGPTSWHSDPHLRRILLPHMLSGNNNIWVRHYFPDEYLAFKQQFGRSTNTRPRKQKRAMDAMVIQDQ